MVLEADNVLFGQITKSHVFRVDHPVDGPELYFTTITVEGTAMGDETPVTVDVTYNGGFINAEEGVFNSEAPSADDVKIGNNVVVFYKWADNLGGDVRGNGLVASHGGLYRTAASQKDSVILGRGPGYAVDRNISLTDFDGAVRRIREAKKQVK